MKIICVAGARPNFIKIAPIIEQIGKRKEIEHVLIHTGQHYDFKMSQVFFQDLEIPDPDIYLNVGSGSHAEQTAKIMLEFEKVLLKEKPDLVLVVGDVNSTIACSLTAAKLGIRIAHVEAVLRSFDRTMPEEINRILTDAISDYLFTTEKSGMINLLREGVKRDKIFFVGNVMIDSLLKNIKKARRSDVLKRLNLKEQEYALVTLHRPANVDNKDGLIKIFEALEQIQKQIRIVYPSHPRTQKNISDYNLVKRFTFLQKSTEGINKGNLTITDPLGYLDFVMLMSKARFILTDSGGIQEESTVLNTPCLTMRNNTERPVTIEMGTNKLIGTDKKRIINESLKIIRGKKKNVQIPPLWDGKAAKRIVDILLKRKISK